MAFSLSSSIKSVSDEIRSTAVTYADKKLVTFLFKLTSKKYYNLNSIEHHALHCVFKKLQEVSLIK